MTDAASPRISVEERHLAAARLVRKHARVSELRDVVAGALERCASLCLDNDDERERVLAAVLAAIVESADGAYVRELLGPDRDSWLSRGMAHGLTSQRLMDAAARLAGGVE